MLGDGNIYKKDIDFAALALQDAEFAQILKSNGQLDFSNPEAVQQLTKSLLKRDFGLNVSLPADRLCPPVPNRLNYLLWIQSLLDTTSDSYADVYDPERQVLGLDIGTGASCIYPLLGCAQRANWKFAGTDIDEKSLQFARQNVQTNKFQHRIKLLQTQAADPLLPLNTMKLENIDFSMCNPPFYESKAEMLSAAASKQRPPFSACTGSENEMVTEGGEVAFISRMINESLVLRDRVQWYTSMLGKYSSLNILLERLKKEGIDNYAVAEFVQGTKTRRWGIAWSFDDLRPSMEAARGLGSFPKALLPFPSDYCITPKDTDMAAVGHRLDQILSQLVVQWRWKANMSTGLGFCRKAVWSRAFRRQAAKHGSAMSEDEDDDTALGFKICLKKGLEGMISMNIRWIKGHDSVLFESFCGMVKRRLEE